MNHIELEEREQEVLNSLEDAKERIKQLEEDLGRSRVTNERLIQKMETEVKSVAALEEDLRDMTKLAVDYKEANTRMEDELRELKDELDRFKKPFPIQKGPSVPWSVMLPHESRCQANHSQSLQRIAERGGFGPAEAWCIVQNVDWREMDNEIGWKQAEQKWCEYAERINLHFEELEMHRAKDSGRTREHNLLVQENRKLQEELDELRNHVRDQGMNRTFTG